MGALGALGLIALVFGVASFQVLEEWNAYSLANVIAGTAGMLVGGVSTLRGWNRRRHSDSGPTVNALLTVVAVAWGAVLVQSVAAHSGARFDWTFERRYELAPATTELLELLGDRLRLTLYYREGDPRKRATRLLIEQMGAVAGAKTDVRTLDDSPDDEDRYAIGSSNSVLLRLGDAWELAERPTQGRIFEALSRLASPKSRVVYATTGTGEGDLEQTLDIGFSGLRAALETEGYEVRPLPTPIAGAIPPDADAVLVIAPKRRMTDATLAALEAYLDGGGGRLIAFLEPATKSGLEEILARFGLTSPDALIVDPRSGPVEGDPAGVNPVANGYSDHPVVKGLNRNRMTFFHRARSWTLRKPQPNDKLQAVVYAGGSSWLYPDPENLPAHTTPERPPDVRADYHPIGVIGSYQRGGRQTRIVAFGDSDFASNRYLRALFNLDLMMNSVHWVVEREAAITLRPKTGSLLQFPVPVQRSLNALYGIGLIVPELLVMIGAWVWIHRRSA